MSNRSSGNGFAKCFILFMAIVILIQGAVYIGLSVWGIIYRECSQEPLSLTSNPFQSVTKLVYFARESCGELKIEINDLPISLNVDWDESSDITNRMFILLISYIVISTIWVVLSLLVITSIFGNVTRLTVATCFWPWFIAVCIGSILDLTATGFHINDIVHTTTAQKTFDYVGISNLNDNVISVVSTFDQYFITPSIVMTCLSSRVVVIWFLNIFGCSFSLAISQKIAESHKDYAETASPKKTSKKPKELERPSTRNGEMIENPSVTSALPNRENEAPTILANREAVIDSSKVLPKAPISTNAGTTYRSTDAHPDNLDYPGKETGISPNQFSADTPLNNRYSDVFQSQQSNRVSDELRSQLPWSYTSMAKPQALRKTQIYPEISEDLAQTTTNDAASQSYSRW